MSSRSFKPPTGYLRVSSLNPADSSPTRLAVLDEAPELLTITPTSKYKNGCEAAASRREIHSTPDMYKSTLLVAFHEARPTANLSRL